MIEKIDIKDASIAEEIRKNMASVNPNQNGLMPSSGFIVRPSIRKDADFNSYILSGIHMIGDRNLEAINNPGVDYGVLCVFSTGAYVLQIAASVLPTSTVVKFRTRTEAISDWKPWTSL